MQKNAPSMHINIFNKEKKKSPNCIQDEMNLKKKGKAKMYQIILVYLLLTCFLIMKNMVIST